MLAWPERLLVREADNCLPLVRVGPVMHGPVMLCAQSDVAHCTVEAERHSCILAVVVVALQLWHCLMHNNGCCILGKLLSVGPQWWVQVPLCRCEVQHKVAGNSIDVSTPSKQHYKQICWVHCSASFRLIKT
jgi:hypothetical protein